MAHALLSRRMVFGVLLALFLANVLGRLYTCHEPLDRDITTYAIIGHEMLQGRPLYVDLWDHKPPAVHLAFAAAELLAGYGVWQVFLLNLLAAGLTLAGVYYAAGSAGRMGRGAGLWAATLWAIISLNLHLQANQPNTEVFINACQIWLFALFLRATQAPLSWPGALAIGGLTLVATLFKQVAVFPFLALAAVYTLSAWRDPQRRLAAMSRMAAAGGIVAAGWLLTAGYFASRGGWVDFYDAVFRYNRAYAGDGVPVLATLCELRILVWPLLAGIPSLAALTAEARNGAREQRVSRHALMLAFVAGTLLQVALPGMFFPHYFQLWLPLLAVAFGWGWRLLAQLPGEPGRRAPHLAAALILLPVLVNQLNFYRLTPEEWSNAKYGPVFVETCRAAEAIDRLLEPNESFYHLGADTGLYFYTRRRPPVGAFYVYPLLSGPLVERLTRRTIAELERSRPDLLVIAPDMAAFINRRPAGAHPPLVAWCLARYRPIGTAGQDQNYQLLARIGSALESRVTAPSPGATPAGGAPPP